MDRLSLLLPKVLLKRGIKDEANASLVVHATNAWLQEQGGIFATSVAAMKFTTNILTLCTQSSVAAEETRGKTQELKQALMDRLPSVTIETIRIIRK